MTPDPQWLAEIGPRATLAMLTENTGSGLERCEAITGRAIYAQMGAR